ncbi:hypothetical protein MRB53_037320 [Persea americana]|nr:hypothetical protein MRB53_037320 [Persea americana]
MTACPSRVHMAHGGLIGVSRELVARRRHTDVGQEASARYRRFDLEQCVGNLFSSAQPWTGVLAPSDTHVACSVCSESSELTAGHIGLVL